jgi:multicomponent K+:H+ antiporter subunit D
MILDTVLNHPWRWGILAIVLTASLLILIALARSGSFLFYRPQELQSVKESDIETPIPGKSLWIVGSLLAVAPILVLFAGDVMAFTTETVTQLQGVPAYIEAVMDNPIKEGK